MKLSKIAEYAFVLGLILAPITFNSPANATSCVPVTPAEHISRSDIIFFGTVIDRQASRRTDSETISDFRVIRAYKGVEGKIVRIKYHNDHGANQGWGFSHKHPTLVFAYRLPSGEDEKPVFIVHYCTMRPYHGTPARHPVYWDILAGMNP